MNTLPTPTCFWAVSKPQWRDWWVGSTVSLPVLSLMSQTPRLGARGSSSRLITLATSQGKILVWITRTLQKRKLRLRRLLPEATSMPQFPHLWNGDNCYISQDFPRGSDGTLNNGCENWKGKPQHAWTVQSTLWIRSWWTLSGKCWIENILGFADHIVSIITT